MNLVLVDEHELGEGGEFRLLGLRAEHVRTVIKAVPGQQLRAGIVRGPLGTAVVQQVEKEYCRLRLDISGTPATRPKQDLVIALPRPKAVPRVVELAAAMGVGRIDFVNAWRVDKSYFCSARLGDESLAEAARRGCEQGGHTWLPDIKIHRRFMEYCASLPAEDDRSRLVAHPSGGAMVTEMKDVLEARVLLAVGPEGGWLERELSTLRDLAFRSLRLSERILRSEAAIVAGLAQIELARHSLSVASA